ncbi:MAG: c-type cytochrome [Gemmatimonadetes bacterium]|nr:c-type cytochrome [Gemmatimonadota bacterium]
MAKENNRLLGHADEADGIDEYDNPLPDWWLGLFLFTIVWALGYAVHYHFIADRSAVKELAAEVAAAEARWPAQAAEIGDFAVTPTAVAAGQELFQVNCVVCHGANLEGLIGPSLVDEEWLHGGTRESVLSTIGDGVLDKGMPNWGALLGTDKVNQLAAYVISQYETVSGRALPTEAELEASGQEASEGDPGTDGEAPGSGNPGS